MQVRDGTCETSRFRFTRMMIGAISTAGKNENVKRYNEDDDGVT